MTAREKLANYIKSTLGGLSAKHMLEMADASAAEAVAAERRELIVAAEEIGHQLGKVLIIGPWHLRKYTDMIRARSTQPAAQDAAGEA